MRSLHVHSGRRARALAATRDVVTLLELRTGTLVTATAVTAALAAGQDSPGVLAALAAAAFSSCCGAVSLKHWLDRDRDGCMPRVHDRPLPSGRLAPNVALGLGVGLMLLPLAAEGPLGPGATLYLLGGAVAYALVSTAWLQRRTPLSAVGAGTAGSFAALAGWQTAAATLRPAPMMLAGVLFLWGATHSWSFAIARTDDAHEGRVPPLGAAEGRGRAAHSVAASAVGLVTWSVVLGAFLPWPYLVVAVPGGLWFLSRAARLTGDPSARRAWRLGTLSEVHLLILLGSVAVTALI